MIKIRKPKLTTLVWINLVVALISFVFALISLTMPSDCTPPSSTGGAPIDRKL